MNKTVLFAAMGVILAAHQAGHGDATQDRKNAAIWYERAAASLKGISSDEWGSIMQFIDDPGHMPLEEVRDSLARAEPIIMLVRRGGHRPYADFNVDYTDGMSAYHAHIIDAMRLGTLLHADALSRLHLGDSAGAAATTAALYQMSAHLSGTYLEDHSHAAMQLFHQADTVVLWGVDRGAFSAGDAAKLHHALGGFLPADPFEFTNSMTNTIDVMNEWFAQLYEGGHTERLQKYLDHFGRTGDLKIADIDEEDFWSALGQADALLDRVVKAYLLEDRDAAKAEMEQLITESNEGKHGFLISWIDNARAALNAIVASEATLMKRRQMFVSLMTADNAVEAQPNAAIWYLRGIEMLQQVSPELTETLNAYNVRQSVATEERLASVLHGVQDIIDTFRDGSYIKRCDFSLVSDVEPLTFIPSYLPGMAAGIELLQADAGRAMREDSVDEAIDRFAICYRIVAHLSGDSPLVSAIVADNTFRETRNATVVLMDEESFTEVHREQLLSAIQRMNPKDAFGYLQSVSKGRKALVQVLTPPTANRSADVGKRNKEILRRWNGDQLLYMIVILDTLRRQRNQSAREGPTRAEIERVGLSAGATDKARAEVNDVLPKLRKGDIESIRWDNSLVIRRITERMRSTRADLRRALSLLKPGKPKSD